MTRLSLLKVLLPLLALFVASASGAPAPTPQKKAKPQVIRIAATATAAHAHGFDALKRDFARHGVELEYTLYPDYFKVVDALLKREVDIAWNGPMAHARAIVLSKGHVVGTVVRDVDIQYAAQIVVRRDSGINEMTDLVGKKVALGQIDNPELNALPRYFLKHQGMDLDTKATVLDLTGLTDDQMKPVSTAADVLAAVLNRRADAGAVGLSATRALRADPASPLKVVWTTPGYTHCIMTALDDANPELIAKFKAVLLAQTLQDPICEEMLRSEGMVMWKDGSKPSEYADGFKALVAAIKEQNLRVTAPASDPAKPTFRIGAMASPETFQAVEAIQRYFKRQGEKQFEIYMYGSTRQLSDALTARRVDVVWSDPLTYAQSVIRNQSILTPLAGDSEIGYHFQVVVRKDSGITKLQDLAGKQLVLGSDSIAELSILPRYYLPKAGLDLAKLKVVSLNGGIDAITHKPADDDSFIAAAVKDGKGTAGVVGDELAKTIAADAGSPLKVIWTSPAFARHGMAALPDYKHLTRFTQVMQSMTLNDSIAKTVFGLEKSTKWVPRSTNEGYQDLIDALKRERISLR